MSGAHYWLTSDRIALRRFTLDDLDWLADLYSDPDVTKYLAELKTARNVKNYSAPELCSITTNIPALAFG